MGLVRSSPPPQTAMGLVLPLTLDVMCKRSPVEPNPKWFFQAFPKPTGFFLQSSTHHNCTSTSYFSMKSCPAFGFFVPQLITWGELPVTWGEYHSHRGRLWFLTGGLIIQLIHVTWKHYELITVVENKSPKPNGTSAVPSNPINVISLLPHPIDAHPIR